GDAPMGRMMRRYWLPACLSEEIDAPDGAPLRVRLVGEDLVLFRHTEGRLGALDEHCPHRRASLSYGRNEENGLRCLYHGWKIDVAGNVDLPAVVEAAEAVLLVAAVRQRCASMRAVLVERAQAPLGVAEEHEILANEAHPQRCAVRRVDLFGEACGEPVAAHHPAHRRIA